MFTTQHIIACTRDIHKNNTRVWCADNVVWMVKKKKHPTTAYYFHIIIISNAPMQCRRQRPVAMCRGQGYRRTTMTLYVHGVRKKCYRYNIISNFTIN